VSWTDYTTASAQINFQPSDTSSLDPDVYAVQVYVTRDGVSQLFSPNDFRIEVLAAPGSMTEPPVYILFDDLKVVIPGISQYLEPNDQTGFLAQRADARLWLETACHRHYESTAGVASRIYVQSYPYLYLGRSAILTNWLQEDLLVLTQPSVKAMCYYVAYNVFMGLVPSNPELFWKLAKHYQVLADQTLQQETVEIRQAGTPNNKYYPNNPGGNIDGQLLAVISFGSTVVLPG
jgi:hypothetical protein